MLYFQGPSSHPPVPGSRGTDTRVGGTSLRATEEESVGEL